jgi:heme-degrading monooxygenase HmoA
VATFKYHLAQINIGRMRAPLKDALMQGFVARLDEINQLAEATPGFVWRFQTAEGNATAVRPFDDDRILFNMSVWESIEALQQYVYKSAHAEVMKRRREWFEKFDGFYQALWWVEAGHIPTVEEAKARLAHLNQHGVSAYAFSFKEPFPPPDAVTEEFSVAPFEPCPAV